MIPDAALVAIAGDYVRIEDAAAAGRALDRGRADRPAARFNRAGEDALYLSPDAESARVAVRGQPAARDTARVLQRYRVGQAVVLDLRHPAAAGLYEVARQPWRQALAEGREPPSWRLADSIRGAAGLSGLIDPSRQAPGRWALTLFRWSVPGGPDVVPVPGGEGPADAEVW